MWCLRAMISAASPGDFRTYFRRTKNVARTPHLSNKSSSRGVSAGLGPSSNVSAHEVPMVRKVGPKSWDLGCNAPQAHTEPAKSGTMRLYVVTSLTLTTAESGQHRYLE